MKAATLPRERPLIYSAAMVRAILAGEKTQTRRVIFKDGEPDHHMPWRVSGTHWQDGDGPLRCPHGEVGDRLWVREKAAISALHDGPRWVYAADDEWAGRTIAWRWLPSIHMPRRACRIVLEITGVRVERLQRINRADALAEGVMEYARSKGLDPAKVDPLAAWIDLWDSINGKRDGGKYAWHRNPWTWVVEFRRVEGGAP